MKIKTFVIFIFTILFFSCVKDFKNPDWETKVTMPFVNTSFNIYDVLEDSSVQSRNDSIFIIFRENLAPISFDTLLELQVDPFIRNVKLDSISLNDQHIEHTIFMDEMLVEAGMDTSVFTDGTEVSGFMLSMILPQTGLTVGPDTVDASEYFTSLVLQEGKLTIDIYNGLPLAITNIDYSIILSEQDTLSKAFDDLPAYSSGSDSINDLSGMQINGYIMFVFNFDIEQDVTPLVINYDDYLSIDVAIKDMKVESATARFPEQTLINNKEEIYLEDMGDIELTFAKVREGNLRIRAVSTINEVTHFTYNIPNATYNGQPFSKEITLDPAPVDGNIVEEFVYEFNNYEIDLTGKDGDTVNAIYNEIIGRIDSSGNLINLTLDDSVDIEVTVEELNPEYAIGYLGSSSYSLGPDTIMTDLFEQFKIDSIDVTGARLSLGIENNLGINGKLNINQISGNNTQTSRQVVLDVSSLPDTIMVNEAGFGPPVSPSVTTIKLDDQNSNPSDLLGILPDEFSYSLDLVMNPEGKTGDFMADHSDFAYADYGVNTYLDIEVPMALSVKGLVLSDTADFNTNQIKENYKYKRATFTFYIENGFPFEADIKMDFILQDGYVQHSLSSDNAVAAAPVSNTTGRVMNKEESKVVFYLDDQNLQRVLYSENVVFYITLDTKPENKHLQIFSDYSMNVKLVVDFEYEP